MVMTTSDCSTAEVVKIFGVSFDISIPTSLSASTTEGLIESAGAEPADLTSI